MLAPALDLDARFALWPKSLSTFWHPITVSSAACIPPSVAEVGLYGSSCDIYPSLHIANLWNGYRAARINVLRIVLTCQLALIPYPSSTTTITTDDVDTTDRMNEYAADTIQALTDAFCASIPSHLGNKTAPVLPDQLEGVEFPHLPGGGGGEEENGLGGPLPNAIGYSVQTSKADHYRIGAVNGGWYALHPLRSILKATAPTPKDVQLGFPPLLRDGQTDWIQAQLERVKNIYLLGAPSPPST